MPFQLSLKMCLLALVAFKLQAQEINAGARIGSLGNTGVALQDPWSIQSNQAGIAALDRPVIAASYQNNYLNTDISTKSALFIYPVKNNAFGLSFQNYGISAYSEQKVGGTYAKRFGRTVFAALNANVHQVKIAQYGSAQTYSVEAGIQFKPFSKLLIGTHIANPNKSTYNKEIDARVPTILEIGASYEISDKVIFNSGLVKDLDWLTDARCGLEYNPSHWLSLRGGIGANPFRQFAGFGCKWQKFSFDGGASSHPTLGYSPQVSLAYEL